MKDMATIPYIAHLARMYKAEKRERRLIKRVRRAEDKARCLAWVLALSNLAWALLYITR